MAKKEENEELRSVLELTSPEARKYFMEPKNYCTLDLPDYVDFKPVLGFVEAIVGDTAFGTLLKNDAVKPRDFEEVNHKLLIKKDAKYTFRPIQITNPYLYFLLVRTITDKWKWSEIKKRFKAFSRPQIEVASISVVKREEDKSHKAAGIFNWWEQMEQRGIALSLEYSYMFVTDITNCYPSIYTHSIAWAIHGKDKSKDKSFRRNHNATGIAIDEYIQEMQYGQTNGIPQGSTLFDFVAEIVLGYADMLLADRQISRAFAQGMEVIIAVNKCDLDPCLAGQIREQYSEAGIPVYEVSALEKTGLDKLKEAMTGSLCCMTGQSGAGKSTLLNALLGLELETGDISRRISRGKNTTRLSEMIEKGGIRVMDTAGFNLLEPEKQLEPEKLKDRYPEFRQYEGKCRFRECLHDREPGCAVTNAVNQGMLNARRVERYRQLLGETREVWRARYD